MAMFKIDNLISAWEFFWLPETNGQAHLTVDGMFFWSNMFPMLKSASKKN